MSQRDELAKVVDAHELQHDMTGCSTDCFCGWDGPYSEHSQHVADAILAAGYVKADREEWGVGGVGVSGVDRMPGEFQARTLAELPNRVAVRRNVGHGPWEVA